MRFWDTSSLVPLHVKEDATDRMRALLKADPEVAVWWATPVECASALARQHRAGVLGEEAYARALKALTETLRGWRPVRPTQVVRYHAMRFVRVHGLRAADALQLGAAVEWALAETGGRAFVSLDSRLRAKALLEGFTVLPE